MTISTVLVNDDGDLDLTGGRATLILDDPATAQIIRSYLRTVLGEWFLRLKTLGVPYWEDILVHAPSASLVEGIFAKAILERPRVVGLTTLDLELLVDPARTLKLDYVATTQTGTISRSEVL